MELPRRIVIGEGNMPEIGGFLASLAGAGAVSLVSGPQVRSAVGSMVEESLREAGMTWVWHEAADSTAGSVGRIQEEIRADHSGIIAGIGGGRSVDAAKAAAAGLDMPYVSVPTAASHDGMASPFASVRGERPHSVVVSAPLGVFVDIEVIRRAPARLLASGCGDLVANIIAVSDWRLGHERIGEYYGIYSASLARMSANIVMENAAAFAEGGPDARVVVEALISAGVASCIAGSSRPCSGAEHLFSHALDRIAPGRGLHGEKCGLGSIMMAELHGLDWEGIAGALRDVGAPTSAAQVGLGEAEVVEALCIAQELRPERYTILREANLDRDSARDLAGRTGVL
ncbi:MAG: iron-containing alcohol dehydrogenase [Nitrosopumilaceae archaeon]|nr:iron-containing alcohol dehydrogenase [Nitrosopumilaceae archaeon]